jgi:hypothetical protein
MKSNYTTIFVNPVERISAQGRHLHMYYSQNKSGEMIPQAKMNSTMAGGSAKVYKFPENAYDKTKLVTGLNVSMDNPFKGLTVEEVLSSFNLQDKWQTLLEKIVLQSSITRQTYLEIKHGKTPGHYTDDKFYDGNEKRPSYLKELTLVLYDRPNMFSNQTPDSEMKMELIKLHGKIASNKQEANTSFHHFFISQEDEAEQEIANKREIIEKATAHLYLLKTQKNKIRPYQMGIILKDYKGDVLMKGDLLEGRISNILSDYVGKADKYQIDNCNKFLAKVEQVSTREGLDKFETEYLIQQAINTNVFTSRDGYIFWNSKTGVPNVSKWSDFERMVNFFVKEKITFDPKDKEKTNWYGELFEEVKEKGIRME